MIYMSIYKVKDRDGRRPGELGVSKSVEYFFPQCSDTVGWVTGRTSSL